MTNNGDRRSAHTGTLRRAGYAAALGLLLFSAGYGVYESGVMGYLYSAISGKTVTIPSAAPCSSRYGSCSQGLRKRRQGVSARLCPSVRTATTSRLRRMTFRKDPMAMPSGEE